MWLYCIAKGFTSTRATASIYEIVLDAIGGGEFDDIFVRTVNCVSSICIECKNTYVRMTQSNKPCDLFFGNSIARHLASLEVILKGPARPLNRAKADTAPGECGFAPCARAWGRYTPAPQWSTLLYQRFDYMVVFSTGI